MRSTEAVTARRAAEDRALILRDRPGAAGRPAGAVLLLHGGRAEGRGTSRALHLASLRMLPFARAIAAAVRVAGPGAGGADAREPDGPRDDAAPLVGRVRYRYRGWNGPSADPLQDARDALAALTRRFGDLPIVLVGHSMGGRAALRAAAHPLVRGVVALAPWCLPDEPVRHLGGTGVLVLHGDHDRVTSRDLSLDLVRRARVAGARAGHLTVAGGEHAMLRRAGLWHTTAAATATAFLTGTPLPAPAATALADGAAGRV